MATNSSDPSKELCYIQLKVLFHKDHLKTYLEDVDDSELSDIVGFLNGGVNDFTGFFSLFTLYLGGLSFFLGTGLRNFCSVCLDLERDLLDL